jgi:fucose permease
MGFGDVVGPMVSLAKQSFQLSNFTAQLLPLMGFIMFGLLSVPLGIYQDRKGKKYLLLLGLIIAFTGLMIPILNGMYGPVVTFESNSIGKFYILLFSLLLLGAGATTLQVSGNPIMRDVSQPGSFSSNLSMGQSIKAIGSSMGFLLPPLVARPLGLDWTILFPIYAILILITLIWVYAIKIEEKREMGSKPVSLAACLKLLGNGYVFMMVFSIFVYVGAEVSMSSGVPILLKEKYGITDFGLLVAWALFFLPIVAGRFGGALILRSLAPRKFLIFTVMISLIGILMMLFGTMTMAYFGIVLTGLGFANIFPLIFSITVDKMPERSNELSGLMVSAIVGGAVIPPVMGLLADNTSLLVGFAVPLTCVLCIAWSALVTFRTK